MEIPIFKKKKNLDTLFHIFPSPDQQPIVSICNQKVGVTRTKRRKGTTSKAFPRSVLVSVWSILQSSCDD